MRTRIFALAVIFAVKLVPGAFAQTSPVRLDPSRRELSFELSDSHGTMRHIFAGQSYSILGITTREGKRIAKVVVPRATLRSKEPASVNGRETGAYRMSFNLSSDEDAKNIEDFIKHGGEITGISVDSPKTH